MFSVASLIRVEQDDLQKEKNFPGCERTKTVIGLEVGDRQLAAQAVGSSRVAELGWNSGHECCHAQLHYIPGPQWILDILKQDRSCCLSRQAFNLQTYHVSLLKARVTGPGQRTSITVVLRLDLM